MTRRKAQRRPNAARNTDQDARNGVLLPAYQKDLLAEALEKHARRQTPPTVTAQHVADAMRRDLHRKHSQRPRPKPETVTLAIPRRYWPAVHEAALQQGIPIRTERLPRTVTTPLRITTTEGGALRLQASVPALQGNQEQP